MADIADNLATVVAQPKSASVDGVSVQQQSATDIIEADRYTLAKAGRRTPAAQIVRMQIVPPGAV